MEAAELRLEEMTRTWKQVILGGKRHRFCSVFRLGISKFPQSALLYDNLGGIYLFYDDVDSAIYCYEKSLEIFPENRNASEILKEIRN